MRKQEMLNPLNEKTENVESIEWEDKNCRIFWMRKQKLSNKIEWENKIYWMKLNERKNVESKWLINYWREAPVWFEKQIYL